MALTPGTTHGGHPASRGAPGGGLAITRKLAHMMGGDVTVTSEHGGVQRSRVSPPGTGAQDSKQPGRYS
jgi:signal transduction histidine kinase